MFAALHLVDLVALAAMKECPSLWRKPFGVMALQEKALVERVKLPLLAVNDAARRAGIDAGWPLNRALVRCPDLRILPPQPRHEAALLAEMIRHAETLTPDIEIAAPDTLVLDLSRATARQKERLDWLEMADGGELRHVRAATPDLAALAVRAENCHGGFVTAESLHPLPLSFLAPLPGGGELVERLEDWGLHTLGEFMKLPHQALTERLGPVAAEWHSLLHGRKRRLLRLHRPPESLAQELDLEHPLAESEPLLFAFQRLLGPLSARLLARHVAVRALRLGFHFEDGGEMSRTLRLPEPRSDALLDPIQHLLDSLMLPAPVLRITLDVETSEPAATQRDAFQRQLPRPRQWQETLARLHALLGEERVGIPVPSADHRSEGFHLRQPGEPSEETEAWPSCPVPLRRFRPPYEVHVAFSPGPTPLAIISGPHRGEILRFRGPFLHSGQWWDETEAWKQREWDIQLAAGLFRLTHRPPGQWRLEGCYQFSPP